MKRILLVAVLATALAGCGAATDVARDADPSPSTPTTTTTPAPPEPTTGSYPAYPHDDYSYVLKVSCFCADAGLPYRVTVVDGEVVKVVYARTGHGHQAGDLLNSDWMRVTLADIIDAANDTEAVQVDVKWPGGQDYPTSVYVDQERNMIDEEIGYYVSEVVPSD